MLEIENAVMADGVGITSTDGKESDKGTFRDGNWHLSHQFNHTNSVKYFINKNVFLIVSDTANISLLKMVKLYWHENKYQNFNSIGFGPELVQKRDC